MRIQRKEGEIPWMEWRQKRIWGWWSKAIQIRVKYGIMQKGWGWNNPMFYSSIETKETIIFSPLNLMHSFRRRVERKIFYSRNILVKDSRAGHIPLFKRRIYFSPFNFRRKRHILVCRLIHLSHKTKNITKLTLDLYNVRLLFNFVCFRLLARTLQTIIKQLI